MCLCERDFAVKARNVSLCVTYIDEFVLKTEYLSPPYMATGRAGQTANNDKCEISLIFEH